MSSHKDEDFYAAAAPDINENDDRVDREDYENKVDDGGDDNDDDHDDNDDGQDDNDDEDAGCGNDTVRLKIKKMIRDVIAFLSTVLIALDTKTVHTN